MRECLLGLAVGQCSLMFQNRLSLPSQPEAWSHFENSVLGMSGPSKNYHRSRPSDT
ncbi:unnamed protein product [Leuciscus chuanchicus]